MSIVVPTHNEAGNILALYERINKVFDQLPQYNYELIFADDSSDNTAEIIISLISADDRVGLIKLSRKFGQAVAIVAALEKCKGDAAIMMDADLQDPPEAIGLLLEKWTQGYHVVLVKRASERRSLMYFIGALIFYRFIEKISSVNIPRNIGEFRLIDRKVIDAMGKLREKTRFLRGLTLWPGFSSATIEIERSARLSGSTNYNLRRSMGVAVDGIVSFSIAPLRLMFFVGLFMFFLSLIGILYAVGLRLMTSTWVTGWTLMFVSVCFFGGLQFLFLGTIGEYLGRVFLEVLDRPLYITDYEAGCISRREERNPRE